MTIPSPEAFVTELADFMILACYGAKSVERAKRLVGSAYPGRLVPVSQHEPKRRK